MNILEALNLKKDLQNRIENLRRRYVNSVTVKKGDKPKEDPQGLLIELEDSFTQLNDISCRISAANTTTRNSKGKTLKQLMVEQSIVEQRLEILNRAFEEVLFGDAEVYSYYNKPQSDYDVTIDIDSLKKEIGNQESRLRQLTSEIQKLNLTTEI
jgi:hypothetical protein